MSDAVASPPRVGIATTSGSSGKTTTSVTLAAVMAEQGRRVLLVDTDWQMDASRWVGIDETTADEGPTLLDVLRDPAQIVDAVRPSSLAGVDILPASPDLEAVRTLLAQHMNIEQRLRRALDRVEERYDVIIIDCRAGTELPTLAGMIAADHVIGATWAGIKDLRNTLSLEEWVAQIARDYERPVALSGILPCNVQTHGAAYREALALAAERFGDLLLPQVRHSVTVTEAHAQQIPLTAYPRAVAVADDYRAVAAALIARGVLPAATTATVTA